MELQRRYLVIAAVAHLLLFSLLVISGIFQKPPQQLEIIEAVLMPQTELPKPAPPPPPPPPPPPKKEPTPPPEPPKKPEKEPTPPAPTPEEAIADVVKKLNCETIDDLKHEASLRMGAEQQLLRKRISDMEMKCKKKEEDKKKELEKQKKLEEEKLKKEEEKRLKDEAERVKKEKEDQEKREKAEAERIRKEKEADDKRKKQEDEDRRREMAEMLAQEKSDREAAEKAAADAAAKAAADAAAKGAADRAAASELSLWGAKVKARVTSFWLLPPTVQPGLTAIVSVSVNQNGELTAPPRIISSSGNAVFDDTLLRAIQKSSPLPALPSENAYRFMRESGGLSLRFTK